MIAHVFPSLDRKYRAKHRNHTNYLTSSFLLLLSQKIIYSPRSKLCAVSRNEHRVFFSTLSAMFFPFLIRYHHKFPRRRHTAKHLNIHILVFAIWFAASTRLPALHSGNAGKLYIFFLKKKYKMLFPPSGLSQATPKRITNIRLKFIRTSTKHKFRTRRDNFSFLSVYLLCREFDLGKMIVNVTATGLKTHHQKIRQKITHKSFFFVY